MRAALLESIDRARRVHLDQRRADVTTTVVPGGTVTERWLPVDRVGLYVPGGTAAYPSSVLMNAVPAKVAGVSRLVMVVPSPDGKLNPLVLAAAKLAGPPPAWLPPRITLQAAVRDYLLPTQARCLPPRPMRPRSHPGRRCGRPCRWWTWCRRKA